MPTYLVPLSALSPLPMDIGDNSTAAAEFESAGDNTGQHLVEPSMADLFVLPPSECAAGTA